MCKVYSTLLKGLASKYNDILLRPIKKTIPINESQEEFSHRKRREREKEDNIDKTLLAIEDDILSTLSSKQKNEVLHVKKKSGQRR